MFTSNLPSLINLQNLLDPATLQRSPIFTNRVSGVILAGSRPDRKKFIVNDSTSTRDKLMMMTIIKVGDNNSDALMMMKMMMTMTKMMPMVMTVFLPDHGIVALLHFFGK